MTEKLEIRRSFPIDSDLLADFKKKSKEDGKSYQQTTKEAMQLWLDKQQRSET